MRGAVLLVNVLPALHLTNSVITTTNGKPGRRKVAAEASPSVEGQTPNSLPVLSSHPEPVTSESRALPATQLKR